MNFKFLYYFIILTFIISCKKEKKCEDVEGYLNSEEKSWLQFNEGEKWIFKNNLNETDTFIVGKTDSVLSLGYRQSEDPCEHHSRQFNIRFHSNKHSINYRLGVFHQYQSSNKHLEATGIFYFNDYSPSNGITINSITYNNVYTFVFQKDTTIINSSSFVWKTLYNKEKGVIQFFQKGGIIWTRIN